jgi:transcriptional regulator NrdR family protein
MQQINVEKKGGNIEPFDRSKVATSVVKAGGTEDVGEQIASQIESWIQEAAEGGIVKTSQIREKVLEILKTVNEEAAKLYENYKKPVEKE